MSAGQWNSQSALRFLLITVSLAFQFPELSRAAQSGFAAPFIASPAPGIYYSLVSADFDKNGQVDIAGAAALSDLIAIHYNVSGLSSQVECINTGDLPLELIGADLDNDTWPDLLACCTGGRIATLLINNHDGTFRREDLGEPDGMAPVDAAVGDLNGDGRVELVLVDVSPPGISVRMALPGGGFGQPAVIPLSESPSTVDLGDINGDGYLDVCVGFANSGTMTSFHGDGLGGLSSDEVSYLGINPNALMLVDIDADEKLDVIAISGGSIALLRGRGVEGFEPRKVVDVPGGPSALSVGDVDGDGQQDVVVSMLSGDGVAILTGSEIATFGIERILRTGVSPRSIIATDIDADNLPDIISGSAGSLCTSARDAKGNFVPEETVSLGDSPTSIAVGDMNGDGLPDIVCGTNDARRVTVVLQTPGGSFDSATTMETSTTPDQVAIGDVNADGYPDLLTTDELNNELSVYYGNDGSWVTPGADLGTALRPVHVRVSEITGDEYPDAIVSCHGADLVSLFRGSASGLSSQREDCPAGDAPVWASAGDLTDDSVPDLVTGNVGFPGTLSILRGTASGYENIGSVGVTSFPRCVELGDIDADSCVDVAVVSAAGSEVVWLRGACNGTFLSTGVAYVVEPGPRMLVLDDLDGDGSLDLASSSQEGLAVSVLLNDGAGHLGNRVNYGTRADPSFIVDHDLDGDGDLDLVTGNRRSRSVSILRGLRITTPVQADRFQAVWSQGKVVVTWSGSDDASAYALFRSSDTGRIELVFRESGGTYRAEDNPPRNQPITYALRRTTRSGSIEWLPPLTLSAPEGSALRSELLVSPNPVVDVARLHCTLSEPGDLVLDVYDVSGRLVSNSARGHFPAGTHNFEWIASSDRGRAPSGIYFARLVANGHSTVCRIVAMGPGN